MSSIRLLAPYAAMVSPSVVSSNHVSVTAPFQSVRFVDRDDVFVSQSLQVCGSVFSVRAHCFMDKGSLVNKGAFSKNPKYIASIVQAKMLVDLQSTQSEEGRVSVYQQYFDQVFCCKSEYQFKILEYIHTSIKHDLTLSEVSLDAVISLLLGQARSFLLFSLSGEQLADAVLREVVQLAQSYSKVLKIRALSDAAEVYVTFKPEESQRLFRQEVLPGITALEDPYDTVGALITFLGACKFLGPAQVKAFLPEVLQCLDTLSGNEDLKAGVLEDVLNSARYLARVKGEREVLAVLIGSVFEYGHQLKDAYSRARVLLSAVEACHDLEPCDAASIMPALSEATLGLSGVETAEITAYIFQNIITLVKRYSKQQAVQVFERACLRAMQIQNVEGRTKALRDIKSA